MKSGQAPRPSKLCIPVKYKDGVVKKMMLAIKPSSWFRYLLDKPLFFRKLLLGTTTAADRTSFWRRAARIPEWQSVLPLKDFEHRTIPYKLYGDKGPYFKKRTLQIFSISSPFAHAGDSFSSRLII